MRISVVIPTKNRQELIFPLLKNLLTQSIIPSEIVIIDQTKSPLVPNFLYKITETIDAKISIRYIHDPSLIGLPAAKNMGVRVTTGDIVVYLDDDFFLDKDFIRQIVLTYEESPKLGGVGGVQIQEQKRAALGVFLFCFFHRGPFAERRRYINKYYHRFKKPIVGICALSGGLSSYRRQVFKDYLFDENLKGYALSEDFDFSYRCSKDFLLAINPLARSIHLKEEKAQSTLADIYREKIFTSLYFYLKNVHKSIRNWFYFLLCQCSIILESIWGCLCYRHFFPFLSTISAYLDYFHSKFEKSKFVQLHLKRNGEDKYSKD